MEKEIKTNQELPSSKEYSIKIEDKTTVFLKEGASFVLGAAAFTGALALAVRILGGNPNE